MVGVELDPKDISSPKRKEYGDSRAIADWYGYYAGYSTDFVRDVIGLAKLSPGSRIVDPWNGAGTTTAVASLLGFEVIGNDLNPVMSVISRARSARDIDIDSLWYRVEAQWAKYSKTSLLTLPLLSHRTSRAVERIRRIIVPKGYPSSGNLSSEDCVLLTALFLMVRKLAAPYQGTNPSWWKSSEAVDVDLSQTVVLKLFKESLQNLLLALDFDLVTTSNVPTHPTVITGSAEELDIEDSSVDLVVTSPPYLTRIDYVKAMRYELAIFYGADQENKALRQQMLGNVMGGGMPQIDSAWGAEGTAVIKHALDTAKAIDRTDGQYYAGTFGRYFEQLMKSLIEIDRITKPGGSLVIVVQGSRHRGRVIDLPLVVKEMGEKIGWHHSRAIAWPARDLGRINSHSKRYGNYAIQETALIMRKS